MFIMTAFSVDTGRQTMPPLINGVVHTRVQHGPRATGHGAGRQKYASNRSGSGLKFTGPGLVR